MQGQCLELNMYIFIIQGSQCPMEVFRYHNQATHGSTEEKKERLRSIGHLLRYQKVSNKCWRGIEDATR